ncbi:MAG: ferrochelatase [Candidimonas sp.]|nr:MAG: ferrochelatase [Candidimonas sp.]TAM21087.1 MAG: ferrochelatase [Candidimonas sp.]TAM80431.1 MAG: ferrochelatase [Candidimonas sp.]
MSSLFAPYFQSEPVDPQALDAARPQRLPGPVGVLLVNLGTPDHATAASIRRYLSEFLSDSRVIEIPQWLWQIILQGFILTRRPRKLAPRYQEIWMDEGSPLLVYSRAQARGVQQALDEAGMAVRVELGMRYGNPSIASAMDALRAQGCERILTVPMYPQYAASTTATAVDQVAAVAARLRNQPELRFIKRFHTDQAYIQALAGQVQAHWQTHGRPQKLLLSFHGLPRRVVLLGDPYYRDCMETAAHLRQALGADGGLVEVAFQSRFGAEKWLEPYTLPTLQAWASQGITRVDVMCPGFLADCLETLEEIQQQCRDAFMQAGGERFEYLPCLNDDPAWISGFTRLIVRNLGGWLEPSSV